jgi:hypothetical protein
LVVEDQDAVFVHARINGGGFFRRQGLGQVDAGYFTCKVASEVRVMV